MALQHLRNLLALLLPLVAACGGGGGDDGPPTLAGQVLFVPEAPPGMPVALPNTAFVSGTRSTVEVQAGRALKLVGEIVDGRDLVRLRAAERVGLRAELGAGSVLQLAHLDPLTLRLGQVGQRVEVLARGPLDLLVRGPDGPYELDVVVTEPRKELGAAVHVGAFVPGDLLAVVAEREVQWVAAANTDFAVRAEGAWRVEDRFGSELATSGPEGGVFALGVGALGGLRAVRLEPGSASLEIEALAPTAERSPAPVRSAPDDRLHFGLAGPGERALAVAHEFVHGDVLVRLRAGADVNAVAKSRGGVLSQRIPETSDLVRVALPADLDAEGAALTTLALIAALEVDPNVEWAEPNRIRRAQGGGSVEPNDPFYDLQWHYDLIRMPQAWATTTGSSAVVVAVIDTGSRAHPDLNANTIAGFDFISDPANAADGDGIDADPTDPGDTNGIAPSSFHGTHVAGTIGAVSNNGIGVAGVNWEVSMMHLRVLGKLGGTGADIAQSVRFAAGLSNSSGTVPAQRAHVINMSLGGEGSTNTLGQAVTAARAAGVVIFAAAGNNNSAKAFFPASYNGVVSVSAVDRNGAKAPYSNFNAAVDLTAPGGNTAVDLDGDGFVDGVLSTLVNEGAGFSPIFVFYQGTSMACPHVAGVAALMLAVEPTLTPNQIETILQTTAVDLGAPGKDAIFGHGLIQADLAVQAAAGASAQVPVLLANPGSLNFGTEVTELLIQIGNGGSGQLVVDPPSFLPQGGAGNFATLATVAASGATNVSAVRVTVDRTGLADGVYTGEVSIPSNSGTALVPIAMTVATPPPPVDVELFLLLVDATRFDTLAEATLNPTTGLLWAITQAFGGGEIPSGDYLLVCGSDDDEDGFIFGDGDIYTGAWPTLNDVGILSLSKGSKPTGLNFVVGPSQAASSTGAAAAGAPAGGFRLLRR